MSKSLSSPHSSFWHPRLQKYVVTIERQIWCTTPRLFHRSLRCSYPSAPNSINTRNKHVETVYHIFTDLSDMDWLTGLIDNVCNIFSSLNQTYWILSNISDVYIFYSTFIYTFCLIKKIFTFYGIFKFVCYAVWLYSNRDTGICFFYYLPSTFWLFPAVSTAFYFTIKVFNVVWLKCFIITVGAFLYSFGEEIRTVLERFLAFFLLFVQHVSEILN
jgi:hypothetical protein